MLYCLRCLPKAALEQRQRRQRCTLRGYHLPKGALIPHDEFLTRQCSTCRTLVVTEGQEH